MAIPTHAARKAAGLGVCNGTKDGRSECLLFRIKQQDYHLNTEQSDTLCSGLQFYRSSSSRLNNPSSSDPPRLSALVPGINDLLNSPTTLMDYFSLFASCVRIISTISDATHATDKEKGANCICFVTTILTGGDRIVDARKTGRVEAACWWKREREEVLEPIMEAVREEMGGREVEEWCWKI
jgi:hypothetical protein